MAQERCFGLEPRAKISMTIMDPPQHGHGRGSTRGLSCGAPLRLTPVTGMTASSAPALPPWPRPCNPWCASKASGRGEDQIPSDASVVSSILFVRGLDNIGWLHHSAGTPLCAPPVRKTIGMCRTDNSAANGYTSSEPMLMSRRPSSRPWYSPALSHCV